MNYGKKNISTGLILMALFMAYGFLLIYLRDFSPNKIEWIEGSNNGAHFEAKLAHVHGNLFALLNIILGYLLFKLNIKEKSKKYISILLLIGMLMPIGILAELIFGVPPVLVLLGAISMIAGVAFFGYSVATLKEKEI